MSTEDTENYIVTRTITDAHGRCGEFIFTRTVTDAHGRRGELYFTNFAWIHDWPMNTLPFGAFSGKTMWACDT